MLRAFKWAHARAHAQNSERAGACLQYSMLSVLNIEDIYFHNIRFYSLGSSAAWAAGGSIGHLGPAGGGMEPAVKLVGKHPVVLSLLNTHWF